MSLPICFVVASSGSSSTSPSATRATNDSQAVDAANAWVDQFCRTTHAPCNTANAHFRSMEQRIITLYNFSQSVLPPFGRRHPVFYPFGGVDLHHAYGLFGLVDKLVVQSNLPLGSMTCFSSPRCVAQAEHSVHAYFGDAFNHQKKGSWTATGDMQRAFQAGSAQPVGLLPTLIVGLHIIRNALDVNNPSGMPLLDAFTTDDSHNHSRINLLWLKSAKSLTYVSTNVQLPEHSIYDPDSNASNTLITAGSSDELVLELERLLHISGLAGSHLITLIKSAGYVHTRLFVDNRVAQWFLNHSVAIVHDETAFLPHVYEHGLIARAPWIVRRFGKFQGYVGDDRTEPGTMNVAAYHNADPLPFKFGYHKDGEGVMTIAWRKYMNMNGDTAGGTQVLPPRDYHLTLLSLPKCGRTWTVCMLAQMLDSTLPLDKSDTLVKSVGLVYTHGEKIISRLHPFAVASNGVFSSEQAAANLRARFCGHHSQRVIVITRDPRDALISTYYERRFRDKEHTYSGNISSFIHTEIGSWRTIVAWLGALHSAIHSLPHSCRRQFLVVSYEELTACAACSLERILRFIQHLDASSHTHSDIDFISTAVARCSFTSLKQFNSSNLKWGMAVQGVPESNKVRAGVVGGFTDELQREDLLFINDTLRLNTDAIWVDDSTLWS